MKYEGKKTEKVINCSSSEAFVRGVKALNQLGYDIVEQSLEFGSIKFVSTENVLTANGNYLYNFRFVSLNEHSTQCIIWSEESLDAAIPLFELMFGLSTKFAKKVLNLMQ